jgi:hypothetical protein
MSAIEKRYLFVMLIQNLVKAGFLSADLGVAAIQRFQEKGNNRDDLEDALLEYDKNKDVPLLVSALQSIVHS